MIQTPLERLKVNVETQSWWQGVIDDPKFALILDALREKLEMEPPKIPETTSVVDTFGLAHAAHLGTLATLKAMGLLGTRYYAEVRQREEQQKHGEQTLNPARAGRGYGERARQEAKAAGTPA